MPDRRLSTVYDFADLRLHPDGTRVYQAPTNLRPRLVKSTVKTARGAWIARDAGGSGMVPKFRRRKRANEEDEQEQEEQEEIDIEAEAEAEAETEKKKDDDQRPEGEHVSSGGEDEEDEILKGKEGQHAGKRKGKQFDWRKPKKLKFAKDFNYLAPPASEIASSSKNVADTNVEETAQEAPDEQTLPEPSPDLLKAIHKYASEFYAERGQLLDVSREYRKERKKKALRRRARREAEERTGKKAVLSRSRSVSVSSSSSDGGLSSEQDSSSESEEEEEDEEVNKGKGKGKAKRNSRPRQAERLYTDMYKMFDGSALMALGMLVQEHIAHLLAPQIPVGWDEQMRNTYGSESDTGGFEFGENGDDLEEDGEGEEDGQRKEEKGRGDDEDEDEDGLKEAGKFQRRRSKRIAKDYDSDVDEWVDEEDEFTEGQDDGETGAEGTGDSDNDDNLENRYLPSLPILLAIQKNSSKVHGGGPEALNDLGDQALPLRDADGAESDKDDLQDTSSESLRSEDTMHSDSEGEFV